MRLLSFLATVLVLSSFLPANAQQRGIKIQYKARETADAPVAGTVNLYPKSYALVIGNDLYTDGWSRLSNGVKDAREIAKALEGVGFQVTLKTNLKRRDFAQSIEDWIFEYGGDQDARLFIWYAGHGHTDSKGEGYLVPVDAPSPSKGEFQFKRYGLNMRNFGTWVRTAQTNHVYAVFDSCFAGTVFNSARAAPPPAITLATTKPVRQFLTSGDADQTVSDDGTFRRLFIEALQGERRADANGDGYLTASELGMFMGDQITNLTEGAQTPRHGKLRDPDYNQGDFVFAQLMSASPLPTRQAPSRQVSVSSAPVAAVAEAPPAQLVLKAQQGLNTLGYRVAENGSLDARTAATVRQFEADQGLVQTGAIDAILIEQLATELRNRDNTAWEKAKSSRTISALVAYRDTWPDGLHQGEVESAAWASATRQNSAKAYDAYMKAFPNGSNVSLAKSKKTDLAKGARDRSAWNAAKGKRSISALDEYAAQWPDGQFIRDIPRQKTLVRRALNLSPLRVQNDGRFDLSPSNSVGGFDAITDGGFVIATAAFIKENGWESQLVWTDKDLNPIRSKTYSSVRSSLPRSVIATSDGGYVFGGYDYGKGSKNNSPWVIKVDALGNKLWEKRYGADSQGRVGSLMPLANGGVLVIGNFFTKQKMFDGWLLALDRNGNQMWEKTFGAQNWDKFLAALKTSDGGLLLAGETWYRNKGKNDAWIVKLDRNYNMVWEKVYGGKEQDIMLAVTETSDGQYLVSGTTLSKGAGDTDIWTLKLDRRGNKLWDKTYGEPMKDHVRAVLATNDGGALMLVGYQKKKGYAAGMYLMRIDRRGNEMWKRWNLGGNIRDFIALRQNPDQSLYILGRERKGGGGSIAKLGPPSVATYSAMSKAAGN